MSRGTISTRKASRRRRLARFRATDRPRVRGAVTAWRITFAPFGRARNEKSSCCSRRPSLRTAAMSAFRRKRAASTHANALDDSESLAATRATRGEDTPTASRLHARAKTMHARTTAGLRLIGALHDRGPLLPREVQEIKDRRVAVCA